MGNDNSKEILELSEDSSESESDYSLEPRRVKNTNVSFVASSPEGKIKPDLNIIGSTSRMTLNGFENVSDFINRDLTMDAAMQTMHFPKPEFALTSDKVLEIEKELDDYEIISLVYLLYESAHYALQELLLLLSGAQKNLLYNWATSEENRGSQWQKKLIEAICIIKNYKILRSLGYQKQDLIAHYLPHRSNALTSINKVRKAIYLICEKLDSEKTNIFLHNVKSQLQEKNLPFDTYDSQFLELYFLKWETMKVISPVDMSSVKKALKSMNEDSLYDMLNDVLPQDNFQENTPSPEEENKSVPKPRKASTSTDTHQQAVTPLRELGSFEYNMFCGPSIDTHPMTSQLESLEYHMFCGPVIDQDMNTPVNDDNSRYKIDANNPGLVLIINQEVFYTEVNDKFKDLLPKDIHYNKLEAREGTEKDKNDLKNIFEKFGFKVAVEDNLTHEDIITKIKEVVKSVKDESSLFVCIMSHGDKGVVYGSNSCRVKVSKIQEIMYKTNKEYLTDKPKILILQSCQGKKCQKIDEDSEEEYDDKNSTMSTDGPKQSTPKTADMLTFWATVSGYAAIRNKRTGSWFIQALCQKMEELGNKNHFADICTRIVNDVASRKWIVHEDDKNAQTPVVMTTLRRDFYLPRIRDV